MPAFIVSADESTAEFQTGWLHTRHCHRYNLGTFTPLYGQYDRCYTICVDLQQKQEVAIGDIIINCSATLHAMMESRSTASHDGNRKRPPKGLRRSCWECENKPFED